MHWRLLKDGGGRERFEAIEDRIKTDGWFKTVETVESVGGVRLKKLRREIIRYLGSQIPEIRLSFDSVAVRVSFAITPLPDAERLAIMADIAAASKRKVESDALYFQAKALASDSIPVLQAGARWFLREGNRD
jgi:hypothetical protein